MKKSYIIQHKKSGIKWYEHVLTEFTIDEILALTIEINKKFPDTWVEGWNNIHWAFNNAFIELYQKMKVKVQNNGQCCFNLDEVLTQEQIKYLSKECNVPLPFVETWKRD